MIVHIGFDAEGFATGWGTSSVEGSTVEMELPEDHPFFTCIMAHRIQDGELHFEAERLARLIEEQEREAVDPQEEMKMLKRRQDESENAILTLMEITLMGGM